MAFFTVNRWEGGKACPNLKAMKSIKEFYDAHSIDYSHVEEAWLDYNREGK